MGIPAIEQIGKNPFYINSLGPIEAGGGSKKVQPTGSEGGYNPFGAISKIDGEVTPTLGTTGSSYTNGLGHSVHTKNWVF